MTYYRPIVRWGAPRPAEALPLAGGPAWFAEAERLARGEPPRLVPVAEVPEDWRARLAAPRPPLAGVTLDRPRIMGILNVTPDSFSDGGVHFAPETAVESGAEMAAAGAAFLDVGGESTRPGSTAVPAGEEIARIEGVIASLSARVAAPISIDTRKAAVARAAVAAGASVVNDVSALGYDPALAGFCAEAGLPVILMHAQGEPETMQDDPRYDDVLLDVFDALADHVARAEAAGIPRARIVVDPGIGFGKTVAHNLALIRGLALFHGLGVPVMLGASRKGFIGRISGAPGGAARAPGSVAVALRAAAEGAQLLRVHDVAETAQALALWRAVETGEAA
ncbi:dihydropteroate synthase [Rhodosalinus halophilus]|uniref:Dihydropteroate synthase n=1 Tax=Rhodosalinus halophilus TaxID=2259333 RepID=A0A365UC76_9RHOB|nr:dihydropteroate synthase [Rhodosalinus halophilus]RBI86972.1 dihydropteroate synthase [Rhodosalinus halophilus]